ncbi:MAG: hypothetical protein K0S61_688 [Anaerocolumna sp.]|jgi:hypothetical protein|nr:hypothetical protein [Anaerocolumna sp.]
MAKQETKWGKQFSEEPLVDLFIPKDKLNKDNAKWLCINGEEIWLAVGKRIKVPVSVAELWNRSYSETIEAEEKMSQNIEIQS